MQESEYLKVLHERYFMAKSRKEKSCILDEYLRNNHQNRKYVVRKINSLIPSTPKKRIREEIYDGYVMVALAKFWDL